MDYISRIDEYRDEMIETLAQSVSFCSVNAPKALNELGELCPYGVQTVDCLKSILGKGNELGFVSRNFDNYAGHIEWRVNDSKEYIGIVGHLDVVPAVDSEWDTKPFELAKKDGMLYGRGTSDDKGPMIACLYAMKALKDCGFEPSKNIRLVFATDEEVGDESIMYYTERAGQPVLGFTPDSEFPLIQGELGILSFDLAQKLKSGVSKEGLRLTKLEGGTAPNAVPSYAKAVVSTNNTELYELIRDKLDLYVRETDYNIKAKRSGSSLMLEAYGVTAHGSLPWKGVNAISIMMDFLGRLEFNAEDVNDFIDIYNKKIGFVLDGSGIGCGLEDEKSGKLVFNVGMAKFTEEIASVTVNIRYPVTLTSDEVYEGIENSLEDTKIGIVKKMDIEPLYMETDSELVKKLMAAYIEETSDTDSKPIISGGGTYAKFVDNILAFGALLPDDENTMHEANEKISVESYLKMAKIYARAIAAIAE